MVAIDKYHIYENNSFGLLNSKTVEETSKVEDLLSKCTGKLYCNYMQP